MNILVTGGAGYIGSHTVVELIENGYNVIILDNLANSSENVIFTLRKLTGKEIPFFKGDLVDKSFLRDVFESCKIDACIHFAALKAVNESIHKPLEYYRNNIDGTLSLIEVMREYGCKNLIYSSSATVYGNSKCQPLCEDFPRGTCTNPYGWTKVMLEQILSDVSYSDEKWNMIFLRYFNPIGAHKSGLMGDSPNGVPANIMPYITQVAVGKLNKLRIFGGDYETKDGTCIRDFVHVMDIASGHVAALKQMFSSSFSGLDVYNLGTGKGYSILELVQTFQQVTGKIIPYEIGERREGDVAVCYANVSKASEKLGWTAKYNLAEMCSDAWNWQKKNPNGYYEAECPELGR